MQGDTRLALRRYGQSMANVGGLVPVVVLVDARRGVKARRVVAMDFEALGGMLARVCLCNRFLNNAETARSNYQTIH
jgi:uncharacterized membrane protein (UPF0136 family)